jgi:hypothetical protein
MGWDSNQRYAINAVIRSVPTTRGRAANGAESALALVDRAS